MHPNQGPPATQARALTWNRDSNLSVIGDVKPTEPHQLRLESLSEELLGFSLPFCLLLEAFLYFIKFLP